MDLLICAYPLYLTHQYYSNQTDASNLPFLAVWWSTFGAVTLAENYANIDGIPFYWMIKSGAMLGLYSSDYREWLTKNALSTIAIGSSKLKDGAVNIINEHFPSLKQYVHLDSSYVMDSADAKKNNDISNGWFSSWWTNK